MTKQDWKWGFFGIFTGVAISILANNLNTDTIRGLVFGLVIGAVGGMFVADKLKANTKENNEQE